MTTPTITKHTLTEPHALLFMAVLSNKRDWIAYNIVNNGANKFIVRSSNIAYFDGVKSFPDYQTLPYTEPNSSQEITHFFTAEEDMLKAIQQDLLTLIKEFNLEEIVNE